MSRTKRNNNKSSEVLRTVTPYRREQRRRMLREFEQEYRGNNLSPLIEL
jgi:hypothetical protein